MRNTLIVITAFTLVFGGVVVQPHTAFACSCVAGITQEESFAQAHAVFSGQVTSFYTDTSAIGLFRQNRKAEIEVWEVWKGGVPRTVTIVTGTGDGDCGYNFNVGDSYLVYAHKGEMYGAGIDKLEANLCGRTERLAEARDDLIVLGKGIPPQWSGFAGGGFPILVAATLVGLFGFALALFPRRFISLKRRFTRVVERAEYVPSAATILAFRIVGIVLIVLASVILTLTVAVVTRPPMPVTPIQEVEATGTLRGMILLSNGEPAQGVFSVVNNFITNEDNRG